jgi:hypothetical protein
MIAYDCNFMNYSDALHAWVVQLGDTRNSHQKSDLGHQGTAKEDDKGAAPKWETSD